MRLNIISLLILFLLPAGSGLRAQLPKPSTPLEKFLYENTANITTDPIRVCQTLDSVYQLVEKNPTLLKDTFFQQLLKNSRMGACFNAIKPLSQIDQGPYVVINHCLRIKKIIWETEKDTSVIVSSLLYLNSILALNYERNGDYQLAVNLKKDFEPYKAFIQQERYYEYVGFWSCLMTSYRELSLYDEGFDLAYSSHLYLDYIFENVKPIPADIEEQMKRRNLGFMEAAGGFAAAKGENTRALYFYKTCSDRAFEWGLIDLSYFSSIITYYGDIGEYALQDELVEKLEVEIIKRQSTQSVDYVGLLMSKTSILVDAGDYSKAKTILKRAKTISDVVGVPFFMNQFLNEMMFSVLEHQGAGNELEALCNSILTDYTKYYGKSAATLRTLTNLTISKNLSDATKLRVLDEAKSLALEFRDTSALINIYDKYILRLSSLYIKESNTEQEERLYKDSILDLTNRIIDILNVGAFQYSVDLTYQITSLAGTYILLHDYEKALSLMRRIPVTETKRTLDDRIIVYEKMAQLYNRLGKPDSCYIYSLKLSAELKNNIIERNFQLLETGFENYDQINRYFDYIDSYARENSKNNRALTGLIADNVIFRKSMYLNSASAGIKYADSSNRKQLLIKAKNDLFKQITWQMVQSQLPENTAVVEFVNYSYGLDHRVFYAVIIRKQGEPVYIPYPLNDSLEALLDRFDGQPASVNRFYAYDPSESLYALLWGPLTEHLQGIREVFISPDGPLHQVNFGAITLPDQTLLGQHLSVRRILSSRFLPTTNRETSISRVALFGGLDYDADSLSLPKKIRQKQKSVVVRSESGDQVNWGFLEGTQAECRKIQEICRSNRVAVQLYEGNEGSETAFYQQSKLLGGYILHVASHGFTDLNMSRQSSGGRGLIIEKETRSPGQNPLLRTGIVFAGANKLHKYNTLSEKDGISLGAEIAKQSFEKCELVVLSACETGLGDIKGKEGVFGLQRAFKQSGAQKIIASLWQVPDKQTAELFTLFYTKLFTLKSASLALQAAQLEMKSKYPPYFWAGFILLE